MPRPTRASVRRLADQRPGLFPYRDSAGNPRPMTNIEVLASSFKRYLRETFSDAPPGSQASGSRDLTLGTAASRVSSGRQRQIDAAVRAAVTGNDSSEFP